MNRTSNCLHIAEESRIIPASKHLSFVLFSLLPRLIYIHFASFIFAQGHADLEGLIKASALMHCWAR